MSADTPNRTAVVTTVDATSITATTYRTPLGYHRVELVVVDPTSNRHVRVALSATAAAELADVLASVAP